MNRIDDQLDRLFRAARGNGVPGFTPPFGAETRLLAEWRQRESASSTLWDIALLWRGLILAGVITAVSFLPAVTSALNSTPFADVTQLTDSTLSDETQ